MTHHIFTDTNDFADLERYSLDYDIPGRTKSAALLLWFLNAVYRLDETEAEDAVCDKKNDAGFDAICVDDGSQEIVVFQSKRKEKIPSTLGDVDLKTFIGSLSQLATASSVKELIKSSQNDELKSLLVNLDIENKIASGYKKRAIFITNVAANEDAKKYLKHIDQDKIFLDLWDLNRLSPILKQLKRDWFVSDSSILFIDPNRLFYLGAKSKEPDLVYAAIKAKSLIHLPGIDDSRIFAQNVRLGLGNTRVNDDIVSSIQKKDEHKNFITFHNGLTIVAKSIKIDENKLTIQDFSVCNGCQSLLAFYNNRDILSDGIEVLVRLVKVGDDRRLPEIIAYRTNNQNPISLRDLSSNDVSQVRLQTEFNSLFGSFYQYTIKQGEMTTAPALSNELAGRLLLSLYNREPWSTHQKYRIFGDLEAGIFNYHISASHIRLAQILDIIIQSCLEKFDNQRLAHYSLTRFSLLYFLGELFRHTKNGQRILDHPEDYLCTCGISNQNEQLLLDQCLHIIQWMITELNYIFSELGGENYDYKREFKSPKAVNSIRETILKAYDKDKFRDRAPELTV
jgi:hypothetical protein